VLYENFLFSLDPTRSKAIFVGISSMSARPQVFDRASGTWFVLDALRSIYFCAMLSW
jgi:hypothetical protein